MSREPEDATQMDGWKLLTLVYGCLYVLFIYWMVGDNVAIGYPPAYIVWGAAMQALVVIGIFAHVFDKGAVIASAWRWLFAVMVIDIVVGVCVDAVVPTDFNLAKNGMGWVANLLLNLWFLAPAYYLNFGIAYRGAGR